MTSQEMMRSGPLSQGYWWENVSSLGTDPDWQVRISPHIDSGLLFGRKPSDLLAMQYRNRTAPKKRAI